VVYDKRHERLSKGYEDPGPWARVEIRLGRQVGCTLHDAADPERVFYHYAAPALVARPATVKDWEPLGEGFTLPMVEKPLPYRRLLRRLEGSSDMRELVRLAVECGPEGINCLCDKIRGLAAGTGSRSWEDRGAPPRQRQTS
jgi:hypothetical protein